MHSLFLFGLAIAKSTHLGVVSNHPSSLNENSPLVSKKLEPKAGFTSMLSNVLGFTDSSLVEQSHTYYNAAVSKCLIDCNTAVVFDSGLMINGNNLVQCYDRDLSPISCNDANTIWSYENGFVKFGNLCLDDYLRLRLCNPNDINQMWDTSNVALNLNWEKITPSLTLNGIDPQLVMGVDDVSFAIDANGYVRNSLNPFYCLGAEAKFNTCDKGLKWTRYLVSESLCLQSGSLVTTASCDGRPGQAFFLGPVPKVTTTTTTASATTTTTATTTKTPTSTTATTTKTTTSTTTSSSSTTTKTTTTTTGPTPTTNANWVHRQGSQLMLDGKPFRFASYNIPNLLMIEDLNYGRLQTLYGTPICQFPVSTPTYDRNGYGYGKEDSGPCIIPKNGESDMGGGRGAWVIPTAWEIEDAILSIKGSNGKVARTYTLGFGPGRHVSGIRQYNEKAMVAFDQALAIANKHGVRLIIPLVNNHWGSDSDGPKSFGDYLDFCKFRGMPPSRFYYDSTLISDMKNLITDILNRKNTITGILYKDDPTVLAWETGNELGGWNDTPPPASWTIAIAQHIKSISPNALVMDGTMGGYNGNSRYQSDALKSQYVDIFSNHYYGESTGLIKNDAQLIVGKYGKPLILGEIGFSYEVSDPMYSLVASDQRITGVLIWSLRFHSRNGGFFTHSEGSDAWAYHVPGFPQSGGFSSDDYRMALKIRKYALTIDGLDTNTPLPAPAKGRPINDPAINPKALRWFGSAWAAKYLVYRQIQNQQFKLINSNVLDNVDSGNVIYADYDVPGEQTVWYKIQPVGQDGQILSESAFTLGPFYT